jgi:AraC-like DNA-binding protein
LPAITDSATWDALFEIPGFSRLVVHRGVSGRLHLDPASYADVTYDVAQLWSEWRRGTSASAVLVPFLVLRLLVRLARFAAGETTPVFPPPPLAAQRSELIAGVVERIDTGYSQKLLVHELAASVFLSPDRFTDVFFEVMGRTPRDYIKHVRLEHAKRLLVSTTMPIAEVGSACGFEDRSSFFRLFRAAVGSGPREYRQRRQYADTRDPVPVPA